MVNIKYINKQALLHNVNVCKSQFPNIMAMVKANAYGHDVKQIVKILKDEVCFWGVANVDEALQLKKLLGVNHTILVVGKTSRFASLVKNKIDISIDCLNELKRINKICQEYDIKANLHIAINTGMNRIGVKSVSKFKQLLIFINQSKWLKLKGVFTHCFDEDLNNNHFINQMKVFKKFVDCVKKKDILIHIGGSFCLNNHIPAFVNMVRVGYFLYGYGRSDLKPVMSIESKIIKITYCKKGEYLGYGQMELDKDKKIALVPLGYADGIPFDFAGGGRVCVKNNHCPILGRACMDVMMVDVSNVDTHVGDRVVVFNDAEYYASITKTLPYEILTNFSKARTMTLVK